MGQRIGIIAGSGRYLQPAIAAIKKQGITPLIAAIRGEASPRIARSSDLVEWFEAGELKRIIGHFLKYRVKDVLLLGKVRPSMIYDRGRFDRGSWISLHRVTDQSPLRLLQAAVAAIESAGICVLSPGTILEPYFCRPGVLTKTKPTPAQLGDIDFGLELARRLADLDVGQTVVVKKRAVVAVEGMEGTNETIRRSGRLAGEGFCVAKAGRSSQDIRLDVPAVGLDTLRILVRSGGGALGIDAFRVAFFQQEAALAMADANRIPVVVRS